MIGRSGVKVFDLLTDTPASKSGQVGKYVKVAAGEAALEFDSPAGSGDVVGPGSSTENSVPQWDAANKTLKDGLTLNTTVNDPGLDTELVTGKAVRDALNSGMTTPTIYTDNHTITTAQFGIPLAMNHADLKTFTLPSVGTDQNGALVDLLKIGAGNMGIACSDSDTIGDDSDTQITASGTYAAITLRYVHAITAWVVISASGSFTGA